MRNIHRENSVGMAKLSARTKTATIIIPLPKRASRAEQLHSTEGVVSDRGRARDRIALTSSSPRWLFRSTGNITDRISDTGVNI